jgi:hypothetical protein
MFLLSVLTGVVVVALFVVLNSRGWRQYTPAAASLRTADREQSLIVAAAGNPTVWVVAFVAAIAVFGGATIVFVSGGGSVPESAVQTAGLVLLGGGGLVAIAYLFFGTFMAARGRGVGNAAAVMLGSWVLGLAFTLVVVVKLMGMI